MQGCLATPDAMRREELPRGGGYCSSNYAPWTWFETTLQCIELLNNKLGGELSLARTLGSIITVFSGAMANMELMNKRMYRTQARRGMSIPMANRYQRKFDDTATPAPPLGAFITSYTKQSLLASVNSISEDPKIADCEYLASFNWLDSELPTIVVPGQ